MKRFVILLAACLAPSMAVAQCPGGACSAPTVRQKSAAPRHGWYDAGNGGLNLYWNGEPVGTLDPRSAHWQTAGKQHTVNLIEAFNLAAKVDRPMPRCPCPESLCPCHSCACDEGPAGEDVGRQQHFGVDWGHMRKNGRESFRIAGADVPKNQVYEALSAGAAKVPDDSQTPRLIVLGSAARRREVLDDWAAAPELAPFKDKALLQAYPSDHWHVAEVGYKQFGDPTLYLVGAQGKVVTLQTDYEGGPQRLAKTLSEGLRVADPSFDPSRAPDLSRPAPPPPPGPSSIAINANQAGIGAMAAMAAGVGVLFYRKKRTS